jgi:phenylacetate-CoA ligase
MTGSDCSCGCTFRRLTKIYGRNDNMVKVRGVNVFTEAIGVAVQRIAAPTMNSSA